ncbi:Uma2 family endonuclease [Streptomyces sp. NPDC089799]|uniref:Uma2 family endonuclease n=1 Tax=Streptomyces sp. NPDC089799 TaxID=3155066 RepID=UPI003443FD6E
MPNLRPRPGSLRRVAEHIEESTGLRVEIMGGSLVMSPTPRGKHAGTIRRVRRQLESGLAEGLGLYEVSSVAMPGEPDDYVTPHLVVLPVDWDEDDDWLAEPADVELAVEVISKSEKVREIADKNGWYALAGVRLLLVLDPRYGVWSLHGRPKGDGGEYADVVRGKYGDEVPLGKPFGGPLRTGDLPRYDMGG